MLSGTVTRALRGAISAAPVGRASGDLPFVRMDGAPDERETPNLPEPSNEPGESRGPIVALATGVSRVPATRWPGPEPGGTAKTTPGALLGVDEVRALNEVDFALLPTEVDLTSLRATTTRFRAERSSDDLRLPPPQSVARTGRELTAAITDAVRTVRAQAGRNPDPTVARAVGGLVGLLEVVLALQSQIEAHRTRRV